MIESLIVTCLVYSKSIDSFWCRLVLLGTHETYSFRDSGAVDYSSRDYSPHTVADEMKLILKTHTPEVDGVIARPLPLSGP